MLVVINSHSKWPEVISMSSSTTQATIERLRRLFAVYGLPQQLVSDNGPQFTSAEFAVCLRKNGVKHIHSSPYHPSTNGLAEWFVRTLKAAMKNREIKDPQLLDFLLSYCTTPHFTTNSSPCELFMQRSLRTRFDLLRPELEVTVCQKQAEQKKDLPTDWNFQWTSPRTQSEEWSTLVAGNSHRTERTFVLPSSIGLWHCMQLIIC